MVEWTMERVVCGDGTTDEFGSTLQAGVLYAIDKRRGKYDTF